MALSTVGFGSNGWLISVRYWPNIPAMRSGFI